MSHRSPLLNGVEIVTMCDVDNPLCGPNGASAVFGPQKGADPDMVTRLDRNLRHLSEVIRQDLGREIADLPGAGAAGGMGAGVMAFLGSRLQMGIETVLDTVGFDALLPGATAVLTGEGRIDCQSLRGKVVIGIAHRARQARVLSRGRHRYRVHQPSCRALGGSPPVRPGRSVRRPGGSLPALQCVPGRPMT